jgi:hypothetical protein
MTLKIETLGTQIEQYVDGISLYIRDSFVGLSETQQTLATAYFVTLFAALAFKNFNEFDPTLLSKFMRGVGLILLWLLGLSSLAFIVIAGAGIVFDLTLQKDSSFQYYGFYLRRFFDNALWPAGFGCLIGAILFAISKRIIEPWISRNIEVRAKRNISTSPIPSTHNIQHYLFKTKEYDPRKFFQIALSKKQVFIGLDENHKPILVERKKWNESNVQIVGVPGSGKGVSAAIQLYQSILNGDSCVIFNPKKDEWAESVYHDACQKVGKKLIVIDCRAGSPAQLNPIAGISQYELNELLIAVFGLSRQGEAADFYRNNDRKGARIISTLADTHSSSISLPFLLKNSYSELGDYAKKCEGLLTQLEELASLSSVQTSGGFNLKEFINEGGGLLIVGATKDESVITLMSLILVRIIQITEVRKNQKKHVSIFCDEVKYLISSTFVNSLGTIRDKNANYLLAHQSLADLEVEFSGVSAKTASNSIIHNSQIKWVYKAIDFETAKWISDLCGTHHSFEEVLESDSNSLAAENVQLKRKYHRVEVSNVHTNIILNLPKFCAVCIGAGESGHSLAFTSLMKVKKVVVPPIFVSPCNEEKDEIEGDELL